MYFILINNKKLCSSWKKKTSFIYQYVIGLLIYRNNTAYIYIVAQRELEVLLYNTLGKERLLKDTN